MGYQEISQDLEKRNIQRMWPVIAMYVLVFVQFFDYSIDGLAA